jgi:hypothetical protein
MKRIEGKISSKNKKFRARLSRTSEVNASYHPVKGVTLNNKYGLRVSKSFKGLTLGVQGGESVVRGRWSSKKGGLNANLSKSGLSLSSKHKFGTLNWTKPQYSSFRFVGLQFRGKKAAQWGLLFWMLSIMFKLVFSVIKFAYHTMIVIGRVLIWLSKNIWLLLVFLFDIALLLFFDLPRQYINYLRGRDNLELDSLTPELTLEENAQSPDLERES